MKKLAILLNLIFLFPPIIIGQYIVWTNGTTSINVSKTDGTERKEILLNYSPLAFIQDAENERLYWMDKLNKKVFSSNFQGEDVKTVIQGLQDPGGMAFGKDKNLIISDGGKIMEYSLNGIKIKDIKSLEKPGTLAYFNNKIYYYQESLAGIFSMNYDGSNSTKLTDGYKVLQILVDEGRDAIVYNQNFGATGSGVFTIQMDGSGKTKIIDEFIHGIAVDFIENKIYFNSQTFRNIQVANYPAGDDVKLLTSNLGLPSLMDFDKTSNQLFYISNDEGYQFFKLNVSNPASKIKMIPILLNKPVKLAADKTNDFLAWTNEAENSWDESGNIITSDFAGIKTSVVLKYPQVKRPAGISLDPESRTIFYSDKTTNAIYSVPYDGGSPNTLVSNIGLVENIAVDKKGKKLYWADWGKFTISRVNLDGTGVETLLSNVPKPIAIAVDNNAGKIFWSDYSTSALYSASLDGSNVTTLLEGQNYMEFITLDEVNQVIYVGSKINSEKLIRVNYDGSDKSVVPIDNMGSISGIAYTSELPISTDFQNIHKMKLILYPNPTSSDVWIQSEGFISRLFVFDINGNIVSRPSGFMSKEVKMDIDHLPLGNYFVKVVHHDGRIGHINMVKAN